jgi:hypothetical protein
VAAQTLFGQPSSPASLASDDEALTLGLQFTLSEDSPLTGIWFYSAPGAGHLPESCAIYDVGSQTVVTGTQNSSPSWSGAAGSGWVKVTYDGSVTLAAGTPYKAVVYGGFFSGQNWYSATNHYWDSGAGASGLTSGAITAPNNAGADGGQDSFDTSGSQHYPASSFNATNYWVDVEVGSNAISGTGAITAPAAQLAGTGAERFTGAGAFSAPPYRIPYGGGDYGSGPYGGDTGLPVLLAGAGTVTVSPGTGAITAPAAQLAGTGYLRFTGTGGITAPAARLHGSQTPPADIALAVSAPFPGWSAGQPYSDQEGPAVLHLPAASTEYVKVTITSDVTLGAQPVEFAFLATGDPDADTTWHTASWAGDAGTTRAARLLAGPGAVELAAGWWTLWVRVTDDPEIPVREAGPLKIT